MEPILQCLRSKIKNKNQDLGIDWAEAVQRVAMRKCAQHTAHGAGLWLRHLQSMMHIIDDGNIDAFCQCETNPEKRRRCLLILTSRHAAQGCRDSGATVSLCG